MATIKSPYTFKQFSEVLQKKAYAIALEAIQKLPEMPKPDPSSYSRRSVVVKAEGSVIGEVETPTLHISFEGRQISVWVADPKGEWSNSFHFSIEEKIYESSDHNSKISFPHDRNDKKGLKKEENKIMAFLNELMKGIEPERRFSLKQMAAEKAKINA